MRSLLLIYFIATLPGAAQHISPALFSGLPTNMEQDVIAQVSQTCNSSFTVCTNNTSGDIRSFLAAFGGSTYDSSGNVFTVVTDISPNLQNLYITDPLGNATLLGTLPGSGTPVCTQHGNTATYDEGNVNPVQILDNSFLAPNPMPFYFSGLPAVAPYSYSQVARALYVITVRRIITFQTMDSNFCSGGNGSSTSQTVTLGLIKITTK